MQPLRIISSDTQPAQGLSLAIGNFDGVHLGHQDVIASAASHGDWGVVGFAPHPRRFFAPDADVFELMSPSLQAKVLRNMSAKDVSWIDFDHDIAKMSPSDFLQALIDKFAPSHLSFGADFRFGMGRIGDAKFIENWAKEHGLSMTAVPIHTVNGEKIGSSAIREALKNGNPRAATAMLGRPHLMNGIVAKGDQRGRELGFATANLYPKDVMLPKFGIYATRVTIETGLHKGTYNAASSLGVRPSFGVNAPNFESHILDFDEDIYGEEITVELVEYLRPEVKYEGIEKLIFQMNADVLKCREILRDE